MRRFFAAMAIVAVAISCLIQIACDGAFGSLAEPASLPGWLSRAIGPALLERIDATLPTPWSTLALAQAAIVRGDASSARRRIARLAPSDARDDLAGQVALLQHDPQAALRFFLAAGDANEVFPFVDRLAEGGDLANAVALEERLVARLERDPARPANTVDALIKLGKLHFGRALADRTRRQGELRAALGAYARARALQPIDVTLLLGIGDAYFVLGDRALADDAYAQACRLDPHDPRLNRRPVASS
jgi:tetratricopeptide (TPR) repeat protein